MSSLTGGKKNWTSQNVIRTTVLLFLKLKVRSISTSQQNGLKNRWLGIILAYTSFYWIKISLLHIVYWEQRGSLSSTNFIIFTGAIHPTLRAKFIVLEWVKHREFMGCYELWRVTLLVFNSKDISPSALPSHEFLFITTIAKWFKFPIFPP